MLKAFKFTKEHTFIASDGVGTTATTNSRMIIDPEHKKVYLQKPKADYYPPCRLHKDAEFFDEIESLVNDGTVEQLHIVDFPEKGDIK